METLYVIDAPNMAHRAAATGELRPQLGAMLRRYRVAKPRFAVAVWDDREASFRVASVDELKAQACGFGAPIAPAVGSCSKLPGARGARPGRAAVASLDQGRRDRCMRRQGGRWLLAGLITALPLFSSAQLLDGPSPWEIAARVWVFGFVLVAAAGLLGYGAGRLIRRTPWIPVSERYPEEGQTVAFVVASRHEYYHGRVLGGRYHRMDLGEGRICHDFSTPGTTFAASHWMPLPAAPGIVEGE